MNSTPNNVAEPVVVSKKRATRSGEPHKLTADVEGVEFHNETLIVDDGTRRSAVRADITFPELQATWFERFGDWLRDDCQPGETHHLWWSRVTADAALFGGAA